MEQLLVAIKKLKEAPPPKQDPAKARQALRELMLRHPDAPELPIFNTAADIERTVFNVDEVVALLRAAKITF